MEIDAEQLALKMIFTLLRLSLFDMMVNVRVQKIHVTQDQAIPLDTSHMRWKTNEKNCAHI